MLKNLQLAFLKSEIIYSKVNISHFPKHQIAWSGTGKLILEQRSFEVTSEAKG